ncbi:helix-turn-helix domain-containing protein [Streptomyces cyaneofuscatus]|uniref:helix-turn-helix domain-containing protein n=1 Tax=Streptomyces cyaneofuscatus TaxID=66883 RepID=UPI0037D99966
MRPAPAGCNDHAPTIRPGTIPPSLTCRDVKDGTPVEGDGVPKEAAVQEFAELVRALKARDGRSYEPLGRRLSVSASTLHRYCSGTTVPEESPWSTASPPCCTGRTRRNGGPARWPGLRRTAPVERPRPRPRLCRPCRARNRPRRNRNRARPRAASVRWDFGAMLPSPSRRTARTGARSHGLPGLRTPPRSRRQTRVRADHARGASGAEGYAGSRAPRRGRVNACGPPADCRSRGRPPRDHK